MGSQVAMFEELGAEDLSTVTGGWRCTFTTSSERWDDDEHQPSRRRSTRIFRSTGETEITIRVTSGRGAELT